MTSEHVRGPEMRSGLKILGLGAACAAACSLPVILPALGFAFLGIGAGTWAILALIVAGMLAGMTALEILGGKDRQLRMKFAQVAVEYEGCQRCGLC